LPERSAPDAAFIAFSFEPARRTGDVDWPFRQEDNLLYLTGMNTPETTLVMLRASPITGSDLLHRSRSVERTLDRSHPLAGGGDERDRRPRGAIGATPSTLSSTQCSRVRRLARCQAAERLLHAAARARVPLGIRSRTRRGLAGAAGSGSRSTPTREPGSSPSSSDAAILK